MPYNVAINEDKAYYIWPSCFSVRPVNTDFNKRIVNLSFKIKKPDLSLKGKHFFIEQEKDILVNFSVSFPKDHKEGFFVVKVFDDNRNCGIVFPLKSKQSFNFESTEF